MKIFNVNTDEVVKHANRLEQMHRSDFPIAVRSTLNDLAFDVKMNTLMQSAEQVFILRNPNFLKRHSAVDKAQGFDVDTMQSEVGIAPRGLKAAANLEIQEKGGTIKGRSAIYMPTARINKSKFKSVVRSNYLQKHGTLKGSYTRKGTKKSRAVADAVMAKKTKRLWLYVTGSEGTYLKVKNVSFSGKGRSRKVKMNVVPIASYQRGRDVNVKPRPFLENASMKTLQKAHEYFIKNAEKRFEKALRK